MSASVKPTVNKTMNKNKTYFGALEVIVKILLGSKDLNIFKLYISKKIILICNYLGLEKSFDSFIQWIMSLREELNIPHKLSDIVDKEKIDLDKLSKMAFEDPSTIGNPKKLTKEDMKTMYQHSISGDLF